MYIITGTRIVLIQIKIRFYLHVDLHPAVNFSWCMMLLMMLKNLRFSNCCMQYSILFSSIRCGGCHTLKDQCKNLSAFDRNICIVTRLVMDFELAKLLFSQFWLITKKKMLIVFFNT